MQLRLWLGWWRRVKVKVELQKRVQEYFSYTEYSTVYCWVRVKVIREAQPVAIRTP